MDDAQKLIMKIRVLQKSEIGKLVDKRLKEFSRLFSEPDPSRPSQQMLGSLNFAFASLLRMQKEKMRC